MTEAGMVPREALAKLGMTGYVTKDSGAREQYDSGMVRDTQDGKPRFDLMLPLDVPYEHQMLTRIASLLQRGAEKYGDRNWEKGATAKEYERAKASAFRHLIQWMCGETDEDHAAAVFFNVMQAERLVYRMGGWRDKPTGTVAESYADLDALPEGALVQTAGKHYFMKAYGGHWKGLPSGSITTSQGVMIGGKPVILVGGRPTLKSARSDGSYA